MNQVAPQNDLLSMGKLCELTQKMPRTIEAAANELGIAPALRLNGVAHFDADQAERIQARLKGAK